MSQNFTDNLKNLGGAAKDLGAAIQNAFEAVSKAAAALPPDQRKEINQQVSKLKKGLKGLDKKKVDAAIKDIENFKLSHA